MTRFAVIVLTLVVCFFPQMWGKVALPDPLLPAAILSACDYSASAATDLPSGHDRLGNVLRSSESGASLSVGTAVKPSPVGEKLTPREMRRLIERTSEFGHHEQTMH